MKLTSINELTDEIIGGKGSPDREIFEYDLRMDLVGTMIKKARLKKNMSPEELGDLIGVQKAEVIKLEYNTKDFRTSIVLRALEVLGADVKLSVQFDSDEKLIVS